MNLIIYFFKIAFSIAYKSEKRKSGNSLKILKYTNIDIYIKNKDLEKLYNDEYVTSKYNIKMV